MADDGQIGAGEASARKRSRRTWRTIGVLFAVGMGCGIAVGATMAQDGGNWLEGPIPPWLALAVAAAWLAAMIGGSIVYARQVDELEKHANIWGMAVGGTVLLVAYPVWYLMWRGGFVGEPIHEAMFLTLYLVATGAYVWKKFR